MKELASFDFDKNKKKLDLDDHDAALVALLKAALEAAIKTAHKPVAVVKRMHTVTGGFRMKGRAAAMKRHPFGGVCEASNLPLDRKFAHLDELEPEVGYAGRVRWVCPRANNSGTYSCGGCK
jgi:hypothetical protein